MYTQGTLSIARSARAVMFESNVKETYWLLDGSLVTDHFFGFKMVGDNVTVTQDSVVIGFNCGAPPEPAVSVCWCTCWGGGWGGGWSWDCVYMCMCAHH